MNFSDLILNHAGGVLDDELTAELTDLVAAVTLQGKGGQMTLTLKFRPEGEGVVITTGHAVKSPRPKSDRFYFVTADGQLSARHPMQPELPYDTPQENTQ